MHSSQRDLLGKVSGCIHHRGTYSGRLVDAFITEGLTREGCIHHRGTYSGRLVDAFITEGPTRGRLVDAFITEGLTREGYLFRYKCYNTFFNLFTFPGKQ